MISEKSSENDYRSRQKRVGDVLRSETRNRLLEAAETVFTERGYAGTTVARLAAEAGVSVQTLYLAWGSKRELLRGYMERALAGEQSSPQDAAGRFTDLPPRARLTELAKLVAEIAERAAIGWGLYRDAAAVDPEIATDWNELQLLRHQLIARILGDLPTEVLLDGVNTTAAIDTAWAIASPETYDLLVNRLNYDLDHFRHWMTLTLTASILASEATDWNPHQFDRK